MALTIAPVGTKGQLLIYDDSGKRQKKVGVGRVKVSSSVKDYVTLTLHFDKQRPEFMVIRVPINWLTRLEQEE
jgi:hypothetical protein